jgi:hypothetical protein
LREGKEGGRERSCKQATGVSVINTLAGRNARRTGRTIKTRTRCLDHDSLWATDHAIRLLCQINADKDPCGASQVEPAAHCQQENWLFKGQSRMGKRSWTRAQQRLEENERWKWDGRLAGSQGFIVSRTIMHNTQVPKHTSHASHDLYRAFLHGSTCFPSVQYSNYSHSSLPAL